MNSVFTIGSQTAGRDIYNMAGDLNLTQNSPPEDVLKIFQANSAEGWGTGYWR